MLCLSAWSVLERLLGQPHNEHHFIPAFMLRQWERGEDSKLTTMTWRNGAVRLGRNRAKAVAKWTQLYTLHDAPEHANNIIESKVFQKVDDEGAIAHSANISAITGLRGPCFV